MAVEKNLSWRRMWSRGADDKGTVASTAAHTTTTTQQEQHTVNRTQQSDEVVTGGGGAKKNFFLSIYFCSIALLLGVCCGHLLNKLCAVIFSKITT